MVETDDEPRRHVRWAERAAGVDDVVVTVDLGTDRLTWSVANRGDRPVRIRRIAVEVAVRDGAGPLRMFRHGYQSWSPCDTAVVGTDRDPSLRVPDLAAFLGAYHADSRPAHDGEIRSEWVTVLADDRAAVLLGAIGGSAHDVTFRAWLDDRSSPVVAIDAFLGGARLDAGEQRTLHDIRIDDGGGRADPAGAAALLEAWAAEAGTQERARTDAPYQVGWCSWYHYFHEVTAAAVGANLAAAASGGWPFDVFQVDDGYQRAIGDWLDTDDETFPAGIAPLAADIAAGGFRPGIWLAPFLAAPDSQVATEHPDWFARHASGRPLGAWFNPAWGGGQDGVMWALDTTHPEVQDHLERVGRELVTRGFSYLKLDFTFAPSLDGDWHDERQTPAERVRAGYEAVRRGAGPDAFLLGCGAPLANVVGVVDGNRIGQDVAPVWSLPPESEMIPGYLAIQPAVAAAAGNTIARSFMHRHLWLNDPDCLMLRTEQTQLAPTAMRTWADVVASSGGMALVSDDLRLLGDDAKAILHDVVERGRASDERAATGAPARCDDLVTSQRPATLASGPGVLHVDLDRGTSRTTPA